MFLQFVPTEPRSYTAFALPNRPVVFATNIVLLVVLFATVSVIEPNVPTPASALIDLAPVPLKTKSDDSVATPDTVRPAKLVAPVTPKDPPTLALDVTLAFESVVRPVTESVFAAVIAPLTASVLPKAALDVTLAVDNVVKPVTPRVPPTLALDVTLAVPITFRLVPLNVILSLLVTAPVTVV